MRSLICKSQFVLLVGGWLFAAAEPPAVESRPQAQTNRVFTPNNRIRRRYY